MRLVRKWPSALSKTVLLQCSKFVVHRFRIPTSRHRLEMSSSISDGVLRRLPKLPKQHALVFGNSVNLPTAFKVHSAAPLPASDDAKIVDLWVHESLPDGGYNAGDRPPDLIVDEDDLFA